MKYKSITAIAPATVANVACGFDTFGFALNEPFDTVTVSIGEEPTSTLNIKINSIEGDNGKLSKEVEENCAGVVAKAVFEKANITALNINIDIIKGMPLNSGLGSSAATSAATAVALNKLIGSPLSEIDIIECALFGEKLAAGSMHADNISSSIFGGFTVVRSLEPIDIISLPIPKNLCYVVVTPNLEVNTKEARELLKDTVPLKTAVSHFGNIAGLTAGFFLKDLALIGISLNDYIAEPYRAGLIKGFKEVKAAAIQTGALGASISGSGPSVFALTEGLKIAAKVSDAMQEAFKKEDVESVSYYGEINQSGAEIVKQE